MPGTGSAPARRHDGASRDDIVDLAALFWTLWAGRRWILAAMLVCGLSGAVYGWLLATPVYRATSVVMLESREASIAGLDSVLGELSTATSSVLRTEIEVLRGRTLIGRVVEKLGLTNDPEFNEALAAPGLIDRVTGFVLPPPDRRSAAERESARTAETVTTLLSQIRILNITGSLVFQIEVSSISAPKAALIADTLAELYIDDQRRVRYDATEAASSWLADQLTILRETLEGAETDLRRFQSETNLIDADTLAAMDRQLKETRNRRDQLLAQTGEIESRLLQLETSEDPAELARIARDDTLSALILADPEEPSARLRFDQHLDLIITRLRQDLTRLRAQAASLDMAVTSLGRDIERQSGDLIRLDQLSRDAQSSRMLYEHFQTRLKETSAQLGIQQADSRILSAAVVPARPAAPRRMLILVVSALLGLLFGMGLVLLREMQSKRLRHPRDLEALTGLSVLAQVPEIPGRTSEAALAWLAENPTSPPAEAVRNLRTSILLTPAAQVPQVVAVTSAVPGEGKTTLTAALARNMVAMGRRVLLIEGDIRKTTISRLLPGQGPAGPGLVSVLRGKAALEEALCKRPGEADLLPGEPGQESEIDMLASAAFAGLIAAVRGLYDMVLIDTPPVLAVPDIRIIAQQADTTLFLVHWDRTTEEQLLEALAQLHMVNVPVAGLVLSRVTAQGMRHYGGQIGGYDYRLGYGRG